MDSVNDDDDDGDGNDFDNEDNDNSMPDKSLPGFTFSCCFKIKLVKLREKNCN